VGVQVGIVVEIGYDFAVAASGPYYERSSDIILRADQAKAILLHKCPLFHRLTHR